MDAVVQFGDDERLDTLSSCSDKEATLQKYPLKRQTMGGFFQVKAVTNRVKKRVHFLFKKMKKRDRVKSGACDIQTRQSDDISIGGDLDGRDTQNTGFEIEEEVFGSYNTGDGLDGIDTENNEIEIEEEFQTMDSLVQVHNAFEVSYNKLKNEDKAIFFLSCLYPRDFIIPIEELMIYGWGLKLFADVYNLVEARSQTTICVNNLIRANLLTESETKGCVIMQEHVHSFVLHKFSEPKQASIVKSGSMSSQRLSKDANDSYDRILLNCKGMSEFPLDFMHNDNLSLLVLMGENMPLEFPQDLYRRMKMLEVVSYQNMHIPSLPVTFESSTRLRTLYLRSCTLVDDDLCFLGSLSNLEILGFVDCELKRLPSTIGKLKRLRSLDLTGCADLCIDDGIFRNLDSLEELYMRASNKSPLRLTNTNCEELEVLSQRLFVLELEFFERMTLLENMSFENLKRFRISIGCRLERVERSSFRNTLDVVADSEELFKCKIKKLFESAEDLKFQVNGMNQVDNVATYCLFSNLRSLYVSRCADLTYLFSFAVANGLNKLEQLTISECPMLRTVVGKNSEDGEIRFEKLNSITLECLPNMVSFCDNVLVLPEMVELTLDNLPDFISFSPENDDNMPDIQSLLNSKVKIPKLKKLDISRMENLKQIWPRMISTTFMLREIKVRCCDGLTNLFPDSPFPLLKNLEEVTVEKCCSIDVLFNIDFETVGEDSKLRSIEVSDLDKLKELWRLRGGHRHGVLINDFKGVKSIKISDCKRFTNLFTPNTTSFALTSLTSYTTIDVGGALDVRDTKNAGTEIEEEINNRYL